MGGTGCRAPRESNEFLVSYGGSGPGGRRRTGGRGRFRRSTTTTKEHAVGGVTGARRGRRRDGWPRRTSCWFGADRSGKDPARPPPTLAAAASTSRSRIADGHALGPRPGYVGRDGGDVGIFLPKLSQGGAADYGTQGRAETKPGIHLPSTRSGQNDSTAKELRKPVDHPRTLSGGGASRQA